MLQKIDLYIEQKVWIVLRKINIIFLNIIEK